MKNIIIVVLLILLLVAGFLSWNPASRLIDSLMNKPDRYKIHTDSILVAKKDIHNLVKKDREIIAQMKLDSISRKKEKLASERERARLERKIASIDFSKAEPVTLDSVWVGVSTDTMYAMPISVARGALSAMAREPFKDSTISVLELRVWNLEGDLIKQEAFFKQRILGFNGVMDRKDIQIRNLEAINKNLEADNKTEKVKGWMKGVLGTAVGLGVGFGIGKLSD